MIERSSASSGVPASLADGSRSGCTSPNTSPEAISRRLRINPVAFRSGAPVQAAPPGLRALSPRRARAIRKHWLHSCSRAAMRRVDGGAALSLLRWPRIPASRRGSLPYAALESAYGGHAREDRPGSENPDLGSGTSRTERRPWHDMVYKRAGGRGERRIRRSARPAPRAAACPRRQPTVPCKWPQAHATKVESTDRLLPLEAPAVHRSETAIHEARR